MKADEECCLPFLERAVRRGAEGERLCGTAFRLAREARRVPQGVADNNDGQEGSRRAVGVVLRDVKEVQEGGRRQPKPSGRTWSRAFALVGRVGRVAD